MENRAAFGPCIDILPAAEQPSLQQLAAVVHGSQEFQVALQGGRTFGLRLTTAAVPRPRQQLDWNQASAVVTGGTKVTRSHCRHVSNMCS